MQVTISARHTEITPRLQQVINEKIGRLDRYVDGIDRAEVHFFEERNPRIVDKEICEVTLEGHGHHVRCKVAAPDGFVAVDRAVEKLEKQLRKLKTKLERRQHGGTKRDAEGLRETAASNGREPEIVKVKHFTVSAMTPDDAALQIDMLGHDFYLFTNSESGNPAVLYRRADGDYGLIEQTD